MIIIVHAINVYDNVGRRSIERAAHAPQPPTNRATMKPTMPKYARKSIFWGKNIRFEAKNSKYFGREFWYPHIRKPPRYLNRIVFWSGMASERKECMAVDFFVGPLPRVRPRNGILALLFFFLFLFFHLGLSS